ncbi:helix-turn-helix DNA binding domain protein [Streptomyces phage AxeJC]|uniref:Helix-turn-helix DNA binding domain protein n=2 Tax=Ignaciovirus TaxID=3152509 RepID=A0A7D5FQ53_9CAUD|nr:helix-turn-helix DNA-binding domain protein [Streptomyces phage Eklok]YP_010756237.1 helix-turn-helix DNA binding domain protein [Streptomyces phage AxeJC]QLF83187.1 helix-turn-helix DNA-binding domain protein [Streptomyces phage Eklok]URC17923.1 helix-turn-helix DNA binding domain protein [Streptomyces phage AxeJC]
MAARPIDDKDRAAVKRLHAKGKSRNDIAREIGRAPATVSKIANAFDPPLTFDRAPVEAATAARKADLAARRVAFAERLQDIAEREADKLSAPTLYWEWGGKDHTYAQKLADEPIPADRRAIMGVISTALDRSLKLVPPRDDAGAESRSVIGDLMAGLARDYAERHGGPPPDFVSEDQAAEDDADA